MARKFAKVTIWRQISGALSNKADLKESTHADKGKFPTQRVFLENKQTSMIEITTTRLPYLDRLIYSSNHSFSNPLFQLSHLFLWQSLSATGVRPTPSLGAE